MRRRPWQVDRWRKRVPWNWREDPPDPGPTGDLWLISNQMDELAENWPLTDKVVREPLLGVCAAIRLIGNWADKVDETPPGDPEGTAREYDLVRARRDEAARILRAGQQCRRGRMSGTEFMLLCQQTHNRLLEFLEIRGERTSELPYVDLFSGRQVRGASGYGMTARTWPRLTLPPRNERQVVLQAIRSNPGINVRQLVEVTHMRTERVTELWKELKDKQFIRTRRGPRGAILLYPNEAKS